MTNDLKTRIAQAAEASVGRYNHKEPWVQYEMRECGKLSFEEGATWLLEDLGRGFDEIAADSAADEIGCYNGGPCQRLPKGCFIEGARWAHAKAQAEIAKWRLECQGMGRLLEKSICVPTEEYSTFAETRARAEALEAELREMRLIEDTRWRPALDKERARVARLTKALELIAAPTGPHEIDEKLSEYYERLARGALSNNKAEEK